MRVRQGVQAEILLSLALVMLTGTGLLVGVLLEFDQARIQSLHGLIGRGFVAETQTAGFPVRGLEHGFVWRFEPDGRVSGVNASLETLDPETRTIAREAFETGRPIVQSGSAWDAVRFAAFDRRGEGVLAGRIDAPVSASILGVLFGVDVLIFCIFGISLLRRRVVGPLRALAASVREIGEGDLPAQVPAEGVAEIEELGTAFNEMQAALAARTGALEKAVQDLRNSNANLIQAREGLDRAERLAMVGSLAAGVAHEVGNPMGALLAFLDVAARDEGLGENARRCLEKATEQGERVRVIIRQLLDFSRPPRIERGPISLEDIARQVVELVSAQQEFSDIEFEVERSQEVACAQGDASLASQILLNLCLNAAAAMRGCPTRRLRLEIRPGVLRERNEDRSTLVPVTSRADAVVCRVEDSGPGVDPSQAGRIFDPFFTTKDPGQGTGLGLANARKLALEMGGWVELAEGPSRWGGAVFLFVLPQSGGDEAEARVRMETPTQSRMP